MIYKFAAILFAVACLSDIESVYIVNCPANYYWNNQYCVQYNCGVSFGFSYQHCSMSYAQAQYQYYSYIPSNYYINHYAACQTAPCPCHYQSCQHIQMCYSQIPCYYQPYITTTPVIPTTTQLGRLISTTTPTPETTPRTTTSTETATTSTTARTTTTTQHTTTKPQPDQNSEENSVIDIKLSNIIYSHNHVYVPVNVNNTNTVKSEVHMKRNESQSRIKNESEPIKTTEDVTKCCTIYSPKLCKRKYHANWRCYHNKYRRCGNFCNRENIYLRPKYIHYHPPMLIMPPPQWRTEYYYEYRSIQRTIDCSGCINGGYKCSSACYSYNCFNSNRCGYVDQGDFCESYGGLGCNDYDGYFNDDYY